MDNIDIIVFDNEVLSVSLIKSYLKDVQFNYNLYSYEKFDDIYLNNTNSNKIVIVDINNLDTNTFNKINKYRDNKSIKIKVMVNLFF